MGELQIDKVALQKDILIRQNESDGKEKDLEEFNRKLPNEIESRWESSREEDAGISKRPLIMYGEWRAIESGYSEEKRKRSHLEEQRSDGNMERWENWQKKPIGEQWDWLKGLGIYPRRRPVLESTEDLGGGGAQK